MRTNGCPCRATVQKHWLMPWLNLPEIEPQGYRGGLTFHGARLSQPDLFARSFPACPPLTLRTMDGVFIQFPDGSHIPGVQEFVALISVAAQTCCVWPTFLVHQLE